MKKRLWCAALLCALVLALLPGGRARALNRYLRVGVNTNTPPFQFTDTSGSCVGIHIDMMEAIAAQDGYEVELVPFDTNRDCLRALEAGDIDVVLGAIRSSADALAGCSATEALTSSQLCMVVDNDVLASDRRITTAVFSSETIQHTLLANLGIYQFVAVGDQVAVYDRHREQPDTAMIGVKDSLIYQLMRDRADDDYTVRYNYLGALEFSMVVRSSDAELLRAMNSSINRFKATQQYENICNRWLPESTKAAHFQRALRIVSAGFAAALLAALGYMILTRRMQHMLRRQVAQQTEEIQQAKADLERQYAQLQDESDLRNRIIKYSPSGMMLVDRGGAITLMNKSACAIAGLARAPLGASALTVPVFREILEQEGDALFDNGTMVESSPLRIGDSPVRTRSYRYMAHQIIQYGQVTGVLLTVQDVTEMERQRQEEFARQKSSALTRIAAGIAHEIRNPLMTIRTFATLIGTKGDSKQVQESFALYVPNEVDRINRLIDNLIHYAKPPVRHPQRVCVEELVGDSLALIRPVLRKSHFQLEQAVDPSLYIFADRDQIKQVIINILLNGIEAMESKCAAAPQERPLTISVRAAEQGEKVSIVIRDEGTGMTEQELSFCRDPFFSTKEAGTGLGLALCEQYIEENSGVMEIDSVKDQYTQISLIFERS